MSGIFNEKTRAAKHQQIELNTSKCKFQITMYLLTQKMKVFTLILQQSHLLIREPTTFMIPVLPNNSHYGITYCIVYAQVIDVCVCVKERDKESIVQVLQSGNIKH